MDLPAVSHSDFGACWVELPAGLDLTPQTAFAACSGLPHCAFFDSAMRHQTLGRYSYLCADPFDWLQGGTNADGFALVAERLAAFQAPALPGLPPFQGGAAGCFGYELAHALERLPRTRWAGFSTPDLAVGLYDVVLAFDHQAGRAWLISQGVPEAGLEDRRRRAVSRLSWFWELLSGAPKRQQELVRPADRPADLPEQHPLAGHPGVTSDFSRDGYQRAVQTAVDYIHAGDVFQVNLTQRLMAPLAEPASDFYLRLREKSPAPFAGYFDAGEMVLCSASPERFLRVVGGAVESRPIKGTRPRADDPEADAELARQLVAAEKDRAENTMIVDLLRNDLSRVCRDDSVEVPTLCGLESYEQVHHLVSVVRGRLRDGVGPLDALRACFPGGSITGAPKVRAMEIISQLETSPRGPYCGSLAYVGFNGAMDSSILIRTAVAASGRLQMSVGGGVVADSTPEAEYEETLQKAAGMLAALPREKR